MTALLDKARDYLQRYVWLVAFRTRDGKTVSLPGEDFLARFVDHVLRRQYVKIRHIGIMAASHVRTKLALASCSPGLRSHAPPRRRRP